jgi:Double zinc ribbon
MLDSSTELVIGIVLVGVVVLVFVYLLNQLHNRKSDARLKMETTMPVEDQAFNQIRIARAGADRMARDGFDVDSVRASLDGAEATIRSGNPREALRVAKNASEKMMEIRSRGPSGGAVAPNPSAQPSVAPLTFAGPTGPSASFASALSGSPDPSGGEAEAVPARPKLPAHQVEARFALQMLASDLDRTPPKNGKAAARKEAVQLQGQAQDAYDRKEYTEAWKLALRGRRRLGGEIESVAPRPLLSAPSGPTPVEAASGELTTPSSTPCPKCGKSNGPEDRFCRACGTTLAAPKCARCGRANDPTDQFCGTCGSPLAAA